jgi:Phosphotransferase enzyme family
MGTPPCGLSPGGRARVSWSADGLALTKTLVAGAVPSHLAFMLSTPRRAILNELRVNRLLAQVPPPVRVPRLIASSRQGPSITFEAVDGAPLGPKFPESLSPRDVDGLVGVALALQSYHPRRRWFRRLNIRRRLALHYRSGLISAANAETLEALADGPALKWGFAHGDITARNVLRDTEGRLALIDWEWAGLYPTGYELAFLWFSLVDVPGGRAKVESALPPQFEAGFLLSAAMVDLLHLQMWLHRPNPFGPRHVQALEELLQVVATGGESGPHRSERTPRRISGATPMQPPHWRCLGPGCRG